MKTKSWWEKTKSWWEEVVSLPTGCVWRRDQIAYDLKRNERPFGLMSEAEKEVMRECEVDCFQTTGRWLSVDEPCFFLPSCTFRVRADFVPQYAEEPKPQSDWGEWQECEIKSDFDNIASAHKIRFKKGK